MGDIIFKTDNYVFSYRVAGILIHEGKILLQKPKNDTGYAVPGGHVALGETNAETLEREFQEELGADITVGDLKWVAEIFFPWGNKPCHQICLYYDVVLKNEKQIPFEGRFIGTEKPKDQDAQIQFYWVPIDQINKIEVYPNNIVELLKHYDADVQHFAYKE